MKKKKRVVRNATKETRIANKFFSLKGEGEQLTQEQKRIGKESTKNKRKVYMKEQKITIYVDKDNTMTDQEIIERRLRKGKAVSR